MLPLLQGQQLCKATNHLKLRQVEAKVQIRLSYKRKGKKLRLPPNPISIRKLQVLPQMILALEVHKLVPVKTSIKFRVNIQNPNISWSMNQSQEWKHPMVVLTQANHSLRAQINLVKFMLKSQASLKIKVNLTKISPRPFNLIHIDPRLSR